ncbi:hypothetical protein AK88_03768 [Plasmodium fragile]|uniref:Uncharacterized protein n=1 Tax=Plasmodium fragile TaxID=5857 RepID=A0A0D9QIH2_PLAFR|nr:uncharacterized protein AK88_03768 [Plasmodium fragile]KJP86572.1 hypothetical protein AK88_03768 [Plasmodium fragile]
MGSLEKVAHYERTYTQYHVIVNALKLFFLKKYLQHGSPSIHGWNIVECTEKNNSSYLTSAQGGNRDSNDTTQGGRSTHEKKTNVSTSNGDSKLDEDHQHVTPYDETRKTPTESEPHVFESDPAAIHYWNTKMKNKKTHPPHYNIDPSAKTKKIQIYYNCEMTDMERKIFKIKKFLQNGNPVDILLIYERDSDCDAKGTQKSGEKKKKK